MAADATASLERIRFALALWTVTVKVQVAVLPKESVAVQVTTVLPRPKLEPEGGEQVTVATEQLSAAFGVRKLTTALAWPGEVKALRF